jgi:two-component system cell cycle response regulator DivK
MEAGNERQRSEGNGEYAMIAKILVVEDDAANRTLLKDVLTYCGYEVLVARDGKEGIDLAREHMPQVILMDMQMPVMDGVEATKILKIDPRTKDLKIICLTGYAINADAREFNGAVFDDYLMKPIDIRQLPNVVKKYLFEGRNYVYGKAENPLR